MIDEKTLAARGPGQTRRDEVLRQLRELHARELAQVYEEGKRAGIAEAKAALSALHRERVPA